MKWLTRVVKGKKRTPIPPRPYTDTASTGKAMMDTRTVGDDLVNHLDPEKPHWKDPRYESRDKIPWFDFFGFNRDWSWSMFKLLAFVFFGLFAQEARMYTGLGSDVLKMTNTGAITPTPKYARNEKATEKELREAGFAYVGVQELDNIGALKEEKQKALNG